MPYSTKSGGKTWWLHRTYREGKPFYFFSLQKTGAINMPSGWELGGVATKPHLPFIKKKVSPKKSIRKTNKKRRR